MQEPGPRRGLVWGGPRVKSHTASQADSRTEGRWWAEFAWEWTARVGTVVAGKGSWGGFFSSHHGEAQGRGQPCWGVRLSAERVETAQ